MNNKKKKDLQEIRQLAALLPVTYYEVETTITLKGSECISNGVTEDKEGNDIEPGKTYLFNTKVMRQTNHYRRMKRMYDKNNNVQMIIEYAKGVDALTSGLLENISGIDYNKARF